LTSSPIWANTALVVTRDEWGGFFEHVVPPRVIAPNKSTRIWSMARRYWDAEFP
jgi:phospholipase C